MVLDTKVEEKSSTFLTKLKDLLEFVYPDRNEVLEIDNEYQVTIHFPEIQITNGSKKRLLKDLFIRFRLSELCMTQGLSGKRTTFFYDEAYTGYIHSHLPSSSVLNRYDVSINSSYFDNYWSTFCTGHSEFSMLQADLRNTTRFTWDKFEQYLYFLPIYLGWESLAGGPHIRMSRISDGISSNKFTVDSSYINGLADLMQRSFKDFPLKLENKYGKKWITIDDKHPKLIDKINSKCIDTGYIAYHRAGNWYNRIPTEDHSSIIERLNKNNTVGIEFKGQLYPFKIVPKDPIDIGNPEDYEKMVHPELIEKACRKIEVDINLRYEQRNNVAAS